MNKPNFQEMTRKELKKYVLANPTDDEAIRELVLNRRNPNATVYPPPSTLADGEAERILRMKIKSTESEGI